MHRLFFILILGAIGAGGWARADDAGASRVSVLTAKQVIQILDDTVDWYRTLGTQQQNAKEPSDLLILYANRQTADQVVGLAFEIARANAELLSSEANAGQSAADESSPLALNQRQSRLDDRRKAIQKEMAADRGRSAAKLPLLQDQLAMVNAHKNLLDTMAAFVNQSSPKGADANALKAHIDAIAATVPTASAAPAAGKPGASAAADIETSAPERYGLWDLGSNAVKLRNKMQAIEAIDRRTTALAQMFKEISAPPLNQLHTYSARSDALALQAANASGAELAALRGEFDTLAWLFKQTSDILLPLSKEQVLLQQYRHNLSNWLETTQREYHDALAALAVRLAVLAGILAVVFLLAEIWRRAVLRYSHDMRRRSQLLLVRKIVTWAAVICIVGVSFATEISTFATFAGLLTAGVAVAMQSVLVSIVGYFFLIGKYGIRVGDRIQIGAVVGEVIDIGLVRMHLMELNATGPLGPTGRVVAFANLVVFQASGGLFKQIPGVNISWHETKLNLPVVKDYAALKERLLAAVGEVAARYRDEILRQSKEIQRSTASNSVNDTAPQVRMRLTDGHMEALIRYPVHVEHAAEIDEEVSEAVLRVIAENVPRDP